MYTRYATFVDNVGPAFDTSAFLNGVQQGVIDAQQKAGDTNGQAASYTLVLADAGKNIEFTSSSAQTLTIPTDATVAFDNFTRIRVSQVGTGAVTVAGAGGVTVSSFGGSLTLSGQFATVMLRKRSANTWHVEGALLGGTTPASSVTFTPTGGISATNVQTAVAELDTEKSAVVVATSSQATSYTLVLADGIDRVVEFTGASGQTLTVPPNSSVAFPVGTIIPVYQHGAGTVGVTAGAGVTIRSRGGLLSLAGQYAEASIRKRGTDEWILAGDLA
jgi:hypothetical protein